MFSSFAGYRTYTIAALTAIYAIIGLFLHQLDWPQALQLLQIAGIGAGLRASQ